MPGRYIVALRYRISTNESTTYKLDATKEFSNLYGRFLLEQGALTWWPTQSIEDIQSAAGILAPYLRAWEIQADLDLGPGSLRFHYESAQLKEAEESPASVHDSVIDELHSAASFEDAAFGVVTRTKYPPAPSLEHFGLSQFVELAHGRWVRYTEGHEPLPSMAYFVFTILQTLGSGSKGAAALLEIDNGVLKKLSELSTLSGDAEALRKFGGVLPAVSMPDAERAWLEEVVKRIIRRLGEYAVGAPLVRITMADLPPL